MSDTPSLAEVIKLAIGRRLEPFRVALPARVEKYDAAKQLVNVKPLLRDSDTDETGARISVSLPVISNVPVVFPGAGTFRITFPIAVGDTVLLVFADKSLDKWISAGGEVDPDEARHALSDAIAIVGLHDSLHAWTGASTSNMTLGKDGGAQIEITPTQINLGGSAEFVALADKVASQLTALKTTINAWVPVPSDGGAALKTALSTLFATWPGSVAATKVKAT